MALPVTGPTIGRLAQRSPGPYGAQTILRGLASLTIYQAPTVTHLPFSLLKELDECTQIPPHWQTASRSISITPTDVQTTLGSGSGQTSSGSDR